MAVENKIENKAFEYNNPLNEEVDKKPQAKVVHDGYKPEQLNVPIPEPKFKKPPPPPPPPSASGKDDEPKFSDEARSNPFNAGNDNAGSQPINPKFAKMSEGEQSNAAEHAAILTLSSWEKITTIVPYQIVKIKKKKIDALQQQGLIDLDMPVPMRRGNFFLPLEEFLKKYDDAAKALFTFPEEIRDEAYPLLVQLYKQKGIGASIEQRLIFLALTQLANIGVLIKMQLDSNKQMFDNFIQYTAAVKQGRMTPPAPVPPVDNNTNYSFAQEPAPPVERVVEIVPMPVDEQPKEDTYHEVAYKVTGDEEKAVSSEKRRVGRQKGMSIRERKLQEQQKNNNG